MNFSIFNMFLEDLLLDRMFVLDFFEFFLEVLLPDFLYIYCSHKYNQYYLITKN